MKKFFKKLKKKFRPLLLIPVVFVALLLVGGYFLFIAGDDGDGSKANANANSSSTTDAGNEGPATPLDKPKPPKLPTEKPTGQEFTIDSDRDEKDYAIVNAVGQIKTPAKISVRIGAAPKQPVVVNANITCQLRDEGAKSSLATFQVTPPVTRELKLPVPDAVSCTPSVGVQLTQAGRGRIKVFLLGTRRADG